MKRIGIFLGILLVVIIPAIVSLAMWTGVLVVSNNTTTSYAMFPATVSTNVTYLVDNHYILSDGSDTDVQVSSTHVPYMLAQDRINFATTLNNNSNINASFLTGQNTTANFSIIPGYGGYVTTNDATALEVSNNGTITIQAYLTDNATIPNLSLTFSLNSGGGWTNPSNAYDGNPVTFANYPMAAPGSTGYITVNHPFEVTYLTSVSYMISQNGGNDNTVQIDALYNGVWTNIVNDVNVIENVLHSTNVSIDGVSQLRIRDTVAAGGADVRLYTFAATGKNQTFASKRGAYEIYAPITQSGNITALLNGMTTNISVAGLSTGLKTIRLIGDTTNTWLDVSGTTTTNISAVSITNNANNIRWLSGIPYSNMILVTVNGTEQLRYKPITIISGTTLPNLDGGLGFLYPGIITWGANPSGVSSIVQSFTPSANVIPDQTGDTSQDVAPTISANETSGKVNPQTAVVPTTPISPLMVFLAGQYAYNIPLFVLWVLVAFVVATIVFAFSLSLFNHMGLAGFLGSATWGLFIVLVGLPHLYLSLSVLGFVVGLVQENRG